MTTLIKLFGFRWKGASNSSLMQFVIWYDNYHKFYLSSYRNTYIASDEGDQLFQKVPPLCSCITDENKLSSQ